MSWSRATVDSLTNFKKIILISDVKWDSPNIKFHAYIYENLKQKFCIKVTNLGLQRDSHEESWNLFCFDLSSC